MTLAPAGHPRLATARLDLTPVTEAHRRAFAAARAQLGELLHAQMPAGWPAFPQAFRVQAEPSPPAWPGFLFLLRGAPTHLVGNGGFKGAPDGEGAVEIGYEIAPAWRRRGLAREAVEELLRHAFSHAQVHRVRAHTLATGHASQAVLLACGFGEVARLEPAPGLHVVRCERARKP